MVTRGLRQDKKAHQLKREELGHHHDVGGHLCGGVGGPVLRRGEEGGAAGRRGK